MYSALIRTTNKHKKKKKKLKAFTQQHRKKIVHAFVLCFEVTFICKQDEI